MWLKMEHQLEHTSYDMGSYVHDMLAVYRVNQLAKVSKSYKR